MRIAAVTAGLAGALVLTACSSGGSDDDSGPTAPTTASADTGGTTGGSASASASGSASASASASADLAGSWLATTGGKAVALVINGTEAGLFTTGGTVCSGTAGEEAGMQMIHLKCTDGSKDRATGMVDSVSKSALKVTWTGDLGVETYTRSEGGTLPSGLPTASLGS